MENKIKQLLEISEIDSMTSVDLRCNDGTEVSHVAYALSMLLMKYPAILEQMEAFMIAFRDKRTRKLIEENTFSIQNFESVLKNQENK